MNAVYEIEHVRHEKRILALISMLTGLEVEELEQRLPQRLHETSGWYGREFAPAFRSLGYDCSPDFRSRFDPQTTRPCLMRFGPTKMALLRETVQRRQESGKPDLKPNRWWDICVYNNGLCYFGDLGAPDPFPLSQLHEAIKPNTMMQVWISDL